MSRTLRIGAALVLLFFIGWGVRSAFPPGELRDYGSFVASGLAASEGKNPYGIHPLTFHVVLPGFDVWNPNLNPPVSIPAFQAFALVSPERGLLVWRAISIVCYLIAVALLVRQYGMGRGGLLALWAVALAGFWDTLALGQIYLPLVLAAVAAWLLLERGHTIAAGILIGIVIAVKPNFGVWPALLLLAGHYRAPLVAIASAAVLSLLPLALHGVTIYRQWFELVANDTNRAAFLTNASLTGLAQRVGLESAGTVISLLLLAALAAWAAVRRPAPMRASAFGIVAAILASPIAWIHYTLFLLPVFFSSRITPALAIAGALFVVPVPALLRLLDAEPWVQATAGSAYNWAVLLCLVALAGDLTHEGRADRRKSRGQPSGFGIVERGHA